MEVQRGSWNHKLSHIMKEGCWIPSLRVSALSSRLWKTLDGLKAGVLYDPIQFLKDFYGGTYGKLIKVE